MFTDKKFKRVFLIVLDSVGVGELPDAAEYGDEGSNTLKTCCTVPGFSLPNMKKLGLFNIDGVDCGEPCESPVGAYGKCREKSNGKDTTTGHWEICGIVSEKPFPTYPEGFPNEVIESFSSACGRGVLCNKPYSGTQVILDYGREHIETGKLIVYTSADSVFQVAAHEDAVPVEELYACCRKAREILKGEHAVGRVIARPFSGEYPNFVRTPRRHDFSLVPPKDTVLNMISSAGLDVIPVGKIYDIFAGSGCGESNPTVSNADGMSKTDEIFARPFNGLCFVNLVDFDSQYGHRNNVRGYAQALEEFDKWLGEFMNKMTADDALIITSDHGCDPATESTDHSREHTFVLAYGEGITPQNLGTRSSFADIGKTCLELLGVENELDAEAF